LTGCFYDTDVVWAQGRVVRYQNVSEGKFQGWSPAQGKEANVSVHLQSILISGPAF
jgi:hypothetical protein